MDFREFKARLRALLKRYVSLGDAFMKANPEWGFSAGYQLIEMTIQRLRHDIDDPKNEQVSWESAATMVQIRVDNLSADLEPVPFNVTPRDLKDKKTTARATIAAFTRTKTCFLLSMLTHGVTVVKQGGQYYVYYPPDRERELKGLPAARRARRQQELVDPKPVPFQFRVRGTQEHGQPIDFTAKFEVTFSPLQVDYDSQHALFPIWIRMTLAGTDPRRWSKEFKALFWRRIIQMWRSRVPRENLECLSELRREMRLARVMVEELVDPEHARDYKELVQSYATLQAQHVEKTGRFHAVESVFDLNRAKAEAELTEKRTRDYDEQRYRCYDKIDIPGTAPMMRSNLVIINERRLEAPDHVFRLLLRLVVELKRGEGGWVYRSDLKEEGIVADELKYQAYNRLRETLKPAVPEGGADRLIETGSAKRVRLSTHPDFVTYARSRLLLHPDDDVKKLANRLPPQRASKGRQKAR
jgi:hypothetical protein